MEPSCRLVADIRLVLGDPMSADIGAIASVSADARQGSHNPKGQASDNQDENPEHF